MTENLVAVAGIVHLVQLRVADAGRELSDDDLEIGGVGQVNTFDGQGLISFREKNDACGSRHSRFLTIALSVSRGF